MADDDNKKTNDDTQATAEVVEEPKVEPSDAKAMEGKEEVKPEASADAKAQADKPAGQGKETPKSDKKLAAKLEKIAKEIEELTALELSELAGHLEDVFGVSAMPMVGAGTASASATDGASADKEEKTNYDVVLTDGGANKLAVIKAVREIKPDVGLMDAKKLVETAPQTLLTGAKKDDAEAAKKKVEDAGGKVELK